MKVIINLNNMKKFILIAALLFSAIAANAQYAPKYKELKDTYNYLTYVKSDTDPYNVTWSGVFGFFVPGSPQLMMNESGRGWAFLGGSLLCDIILDNLGDDLNKLLVINSDGSATFSDPDKAAKLLTAALGVVAVDLGLAIWSCIDAKRIAKVKNLYYQDMTAKKPVKFNVDPYVSYTPTRNSVAPVAGLSLNLAF